METKLETAGQIVALAGLVAAAVFTWLAMPAPPSCSPRMLGGCGIFDVGLIGLWRAALRMFATTFAAILGALPGMLIVFAASSQRGAASAEVALDTAPEQRELPLDDRSLD